jgi:hypothetical protein
MQVGERPVELTNCGLSLRGLFSSARYISFWLHLTTNKMDLIQVDAPSKCCRDAAQSWEGPKVAICCCVVSNKK